VYVRATSDSRFADINVPGWAWAALVGLLALLLAVDLYRHRHDHQPTAKQALAESAAWVACGLSFGVVVLVGFGSTAFGEYLSGYLIEKSLSVDNVFVWALIFSSFRIPAQYQHRVLFWGIFGALALRSIFIFAGASLISRFSWVLVVFGAFLLYTGFKIIRHRDDEGTHGSQRGLGILRRVITVTDEFDGHRFLTRTNGALVATPLLAALVVVEFTDVIFAVDSVPAILAVSREPFLVFASNAFAILGLRAMYFLLADAKQKFHYLSHALGAVLIFVGAKMAASLWLHVDTYLSLAVIAVILVSAIMFSIRRNHRLGEPASLPEVSSTTTALTFDVPAVDDPHVSAAMLDADTANGEGAVDNRPSHR
jgi:tellurite resistance protein TerC